MQCNLTYLFTYFIYLFICFLNIRIEYKNLFIYYLVLLAVKLQTAPRLTSGPEIKFIKIFLYFKINGLRLHKFTPYCDKSL